MEKLRKISSFMLVIWFMYSLSLDLGCYLITSGLSAKMTRALTDAVELPTFLVSIYIHIVNWSPYFIVFFISGVMAWGLLSSDFKKRTITIILFLSFILPHIFLVRMGGSGFSNWEFFIGQTVADAICLGMIYAGISVAARLFGPKPEKTS